MTGIAFEYFVEYQNQNKNRGFYSKDIFEWHPFCYWQAIDISPTDQRFHLIHVLRISQSDEGKGRIPPNK